MDLTYEHKQHVPPLIAAKWTQDEAVAYECARECITHLMAHYSALLETENAMCVERAAEYEHKLEMLAQERLSLRISDHDEIARIRRGYGRLIRHL